MPVCIPSYDDVVESGWQAAQVSTISIKNFAGRIFIGIYCSTVTLSLISVCIGLVYEEQVWHAHARTVLH